MPRSVAIACPVSCGSGGRIRKMPGRDVEELEEALWVALMCVCDRCGTYLDLADLESLCDSNTLAWAEAAARVAYPLGWRGDRGELLCPHCAGHDDGSG